MLLEGSLGGHDSDLLGLLGNTWGGEGECGEHTVWGLPLSAHKVMEGLGLCSLSFRVAWLLLPLACQGVTP